MHHLKMKTFRNWVTVNIVIMVWWGVVGWSGVWCESVVWCAVGCGGVVWCCGVVCGVVVVKLLPGGLLPPLPHIAWRRLQLGYLSRELLR